MNQTEEQSVKKEDIKNTKIKELKEIKRSELAYSF